ncbi:hypothetical protein N9Q81_01790 [Planktomarina temperata]|jgi:hypothetical protein|nr:hypothetical protein [Planktomarina temperata]
MYKVGFVTYGSLSQNYYGLADSATYSFGFLGAGYYRLDVDDVTFNFGFFGNVSSFQVLNSYGSVVGTSYSTYPDINFSVTSPQTYYAKVNGPIFGVAESSVSYSKDGLVGPLV